MLVANFRIFQQDQINEIDVLYKEALQIPILKYNFQITVITYRYLFELITVMSALFTYIK